jgi:hypothetical protein
MVRWIMEIGIASSCVCLSLLLFMYLDAVSLSKSPLVLDLPDAHDSPTRISMLPGGRI